MKKFIIFLSIFLGLLLINSAHAKSSDLFVDYLTKIITSDCSGKDIHIKEGYILDNNQSLTELKWPWKYGYNGTRSIIKIFGELEPFDDYFNGCNNKGGGIIGGKDGCQILGCGEHKLDITKYEYFWDDVRVDIPREEFNSYYAQTSGDNSPALAGNNGQISQTNFNFKIAFGITLSFAIFELGVIIYQLIVNKKIKGSRGRSLKRK